MRYLSVCSGIEAATVAWHGFGWEPVAFAEIEAFPAAVLAHHYPAVPNLGDLTKYREWPEELLTDVDLLVGGTPCQAFSVAGKRHSLDDERGNLSLVYVNLYHHINEVRKRHGRSPAIALWENVPGVLSTKDNAFGCFIGGLLGCDEAPQTESGKWDKAGFLSSETVRVGYRVLDAQYFGVAQRRRRVFLAAVPCELVERFGERACPSEILSLRESVLGNPPTRGAAWEGVARATASGLTSSGRGVERSGESMGQDDVVIDCASVAGTLNANAKAAGSATSQDAESGLLVASEIEREHPSVARAPTAIMHKGFDSTMDSQTPIVTRGGVFEDTVAFKPSHFTRGKDGAPSAVTPPLSADADKGDQDIVCFHPTQDPISSVDGSAHSISTGSGGGCATHAVCVTGQRSHALTTRAAACEEDETGRGTPIVTQGGVFDGVVAFKPGQSEAAGGTFVTNEFSPTVQAQNNGSTDVPAVAFTHSGYSNKPAWITGERTDCLPSSGHSDGSHQGIGVVAFAQNQLGEVRTNESVMGTVNQNQNASGRNTPMVQQAMQVRRLTPTECAYLQGFHADYLDITFRKKPAADGPKYRALGNSMAVPCMWWLGMRIAQATEQHSPEIRPCP